MTVARAAAIGEPLLIYGYGLAGALLCPASDQIAAARAWRELPADVSVAVLTARAAHWLADELAGKPGILTVEIPDPELAGHRAPAAEPWL
jgi:vacuolar-type H+-ATPase subunit F/Vma7